MKFTAFIYPNFIWFAFRFIQNSLKNISNCNAFLYFKGTTYTNLLKISVTQNNKKRIPLLSLNMNCISARSTPQILCSNNENT